ncbi:MAG: hypothetical protein ACR2IT_11305 [Pirellulales bacterium]
MSVIRVGSSSKYADGWDAAFGGRRATAKKAAAPAKKVATASKRSPVAVKKKVTSKPRKPARSRRG